MFNLGQDTENLIIVNSRLLVLWLSLLLLLLLSLFCCCCCCCRRFLFLFFFSPFYLTVLFVKVTLIDVSQFAMHTIPTICCKLFVNFQCFCYLRKILGGLSLLDSLTLMYFFFRFIFNFCFCCRHYKIIPQGSATSMSFPQTFIYFPCSYTWLDFRTFFFPLSSWTVGPLDGLVVLQ